MIWAALFIAQSDRERALGVFREVLEHVHERSKSKDGPFDLTLSGIARMTASDRSRVINILAGDPERRRIMRPLTLFDALPAGIEWRASLEESAPNEDVNVLAKAVRMILDQRSEAATDCRWVRLMGHAVSGKIVLPRCELTRDLMLYPNSGDLGLVQSGIRSTEMTLPPFGIMDENSAESSWAEDFWRECFDKTACMPLGTADSRPEHKTFDDTVHQAIEHTYKRVFEWYFSTMEETEVNPRHDAVFGTALFAVRLLRELVFSANATFLLGRLALRTLCECVITLKYLTRQADSELWTEYRAYGAGQAKLSLLKFEEAGKVPDFAQVDFLRLIATEDKWIELVDINVGRWEKMSLRQMSEFAGIKGVYDAYYSWPSQYVHGLWGAVRESVLDTCGNPLHRGHRAPRLPLEAVSNVLIDAVILVNMVLEAVSDNYPPFEHRVVLDSSSDDTE
jgi:hypothetical protein